MKQASMQQGSINSTGIALAIAGATIGALFLLVPSEYLDRSALAAIGWLGVSAFLMFWIRSGRLSSMGFTGDPKPFAALGPQMVFSFLCFALALAALVVSLLDYPGLSFALTAISIGSFVFSFFVEKTAGEVIDRVAAQQNVPSAHLRWRAEIQLLSTTIQSLAHKEALNRVSETLRYTASDCGGQSPLKPEIDLAIDSVKSSCASTDDTFEAAILHLESLLTQRAILLQQVRSKG